MSCLEIKKKKRKLQHRKARDFAEAGNDRHGGVPARLLACYLVICQHPLSRRRRAHPSDASATFDRLAAWVHGQSISPVQMYSTQYGAAIMGVVTHAEAQQNSPSPP